MSEDFNKSRDKSSKAQLINSILKSINSYLESMGKNLAQFDMPQIRKELHRRIVHECREIMEKISVKMSDKDMDAQSKLNPQQTQNFR